METDHRFHINDGLDMVVAMSLIMSIIWMGFGIAETNKQTKDCCKEIQELKAEVRLLNEKFR